MAGGYPVFACGRAACCGRVQGFLWNGLSRIRYPTIRQQIPIPEIVVRARQGQKIAFFTGAQCRFRPAVPRPLYEQPDDKQGCDGAKRSEDDDMPWVKRQKWVLKNQRPPAELGVWGWPMEGAGPPLLVAADFFLKFWWTRCGWIWFPGGLLWGSALQDCYSFVFPEIFLLLFLISLSTWFRCFLISASAHSRSINFAIRSATASIRFLSSLRNGPSSSSNFSSR